MRLFVSVDLPDALADDIAAVQADLEPAAGIRLTDPTQAHVTLKFLGEVEPHALDELESAIATGVDRAGQPAFEATVEGIGVFPELSYIRVVWLGVGAGAGAISALHTGVEGELVERGYPPADHAFTPHITIARMEHAGGKELVQQVVTAADPTIGQMTVEEVCLTESTLTPDGPVYETVKRFPLPNDGA